MRSVAWVKDDPPGMEFAEVTRLPDRLKATGVAIGSTPVPYRLDYSLDTGAGFVTTQIELTARAEGWERRLDLRRQDDGWSADVFQAGEPPGGAWESDMAPLAEALDCDLQYSPLTNTMPVLRHGLLEGGTAEFTMAWISVPDLRIHADGQRYTFVRREGEESIVRFEALDGSFTANMRFDAEGLVVDYPGIARRLT
jgi:uncharacterized protein